MIEVYPHDSYGRGELDWLSARYHFSFADYYNPKRVGFGHLKVLNHDVIQPGKGFAMHAHNNMEIITYVIRGAISHKDSFGHEGRTEAGNVQVMTAGSGIQHSEYNLEETETELLQIWITPREKQLKPTWHAHEFPTEYTTNRLSLLVSGNSDAPLHINQDVKLYAGKLLKGSSFSHRLQNSAYLVMISGRLRVDDTVLNPGDSAELTEVSMVNFYAEENTELLLIEQ